MFLATAKATSVPGTAVLVTMVTVVLAAVSTGVLFRTMVAAATMMEWSIGCE